MPCRSAAGGQYSCPRCLRPLTSYRVGIFVVDACLACGGLFIDNAATRELVVAFDRDLVNVATTLGIGKGETVGPGVIKDHLSCPRCQGGLEAIALPSAGVEVDVCREHGTWFDANELPKVARAYRRARQGVPTNMGESDLSAIFDRSFEP